jgi:glutamate 5-kinase
MNRRQERTKAIERARRVVVKVGSAVLTTNHGLNMDVVEDLADQIATLHGRGLEIVLVSSGAVAAGRPVIRNHGDLKGVPDKQAAAAVGQSRLMHAYDMAFERHKIVTAQILLTWDDLENRSRFLNASNTFAALLAWRVVPIVNENDTVAVRELGWGDNDHLSSLVLNLVEADLYVNLTSARGVYSQSPDCAVDPECLEYIEDIGSRDVEAMCGCCKTSVGSGGMLSKLLAARRAAQLGVPTLILSGKESRSLVRAFEGEFLGTWIVPQKKKISRRKFWMAYNSRPSGKVIVDAGAFRALTEQGKSLLPAGVTAVKGNFPCGALVRILSQDGAPLGVGLTNYEADDLRRIMGKKTKEIEPILGYHYDEAVHRDKLLLDAAVTPETDTNKDAGGLHFDSGHPGPRPLGG